MRTIYTSVKGLQLPDIEVKGLKDLPLQRREWVKATMQRLMHNTVLPERVAANMAARFETKPIRQAFFMIRKRCYFLDFFLPQYKVAVEIDGSVHRFKKDHDRRRDADFRSIGIRTIRIKNKDVMEGKFYDKLFKRLYI